MHLSIWIRSSFARFFSSTLFFAIVGSSYLSHGDLVVRDGDLAALKVERLRCEYRNEPLGVDQPRPELSWIVTSDSRAQVQTGYRILVASKPEILDRNEGDLWDSGKVKSNATFGVVYSGNDLQSHQECYWKVMAWDGEDRPGPWSGPAYWSIGILNQDEWQGDWIGYDALRHLNSNPPAAPLHGARWICHPKDAAGKPPAERTIYLGVFDLPNGLKAKLATLSICSDDSSIVLLNGHEVMRASGPVQPISEEVSPYVRPGRNTVRVLCRNHSPGPTGICLKLNLTAIDGQQYLLVTDDHWFCLQDGGDSWRTRDFEDAVQAHILGPFGTEPWGLPAVRRDVSAPPSYLIGKISIDRPVRRAAAYFAALGLADVSLNGELVNQDYFSSGWTDYSKRVYYRAYNVTDLLKEGENVWGVLLADGWYSGHVGWGTRRDLFGKKPRFSGMIRVEYEDGTSQIFSSNGDWKVTRGPKQLADFLVGEEYDATAEVPGWDKPGGLPEVLGSVDVGAELSPSIEWHPGPPVVEVGKFPAKSVHQPAPGVYVFDIGQNIAGVARIKINGTKGQRVKIRYSERLNPDGTMYTANLRLARTIDFYTCKGAVQ
ncbi:MAG: family 78 glycoside hydrolase catalytic domain, partial [Pirellulales bacterium]|nr:family 78 glycoside hydrolase catalytic domain [Pirellulales bacterium]